MKIISEQMRLLRRVAAVLLVVIMTIGLAQGAAFGGDYVGANISGDELLYMDFDSGLETDFLNEIPNEPPPPVEIEGRPPGLQYSLTSELQNLEANLDTTSFLNLESFLDITSFQGEHISQARRNYFALLEGSYTGSMLRQRFYELFGEHSIDDIRNSFSEIFDMPAELVDEGLLNILTTTPTYLPWAGLEHYGFDMENLTRHGFGPESDAVNLSEFLLQYEGILEPSILDLDSYTYEFLFNDNYMFELEMDEIELSAGEMALSLDYIISPIHENIIPQQPDFSESFSDYYLIPQYELRSENIFGLEFSGEYIPRIDLWSETIIESEFQGVTPLNSADVTIRLISTTTTSAVVEVFYNPRHFNVNNRLEIYDFTQPNPPYNGRWIPLLGQFGFNLPIAQSGRHTITNLRPGATYIIRASIWDQARQIWVREDIRVTLPGARTPSLTISNITQNSFTINAVFPVESNFGNRLQWHNGIEWTDVPGTGTNTLSGSFAVTNLSPGQVYHVHLSYFNRHNETPGTPIQRSVTLPLPPESHVRSHTANLTFAFEQMDIIALMAATT